MSGYLGHHFEANSLDLLCDLADIPACHCLLTCGTFAIIQRHGLAQLISRLHYPRIQE